MSVTKQCVMCKEHKDIADFHKKKNGKYGVNSRCKPCSYEYGKKYSDANIKRYRAKNREKINAANRARYAADPAKHIKMVQESRERHYDRYIAYSRKYESKNREARVEKNRKYLKANPHKRLEFDLKKKVAKEQASVIWANEELIAKVYRLRDKLNNLAGYVKYHVDHEIPLRGKKVSGLHVENNLRIMLAKDNLSKGNRYTI